MKKFATVMAAGIALGFMMQACSTPPPPGSEEKVAAVNEAQELMTFDINFVVLIESKLAKRRASVEQLKKEVDILNKYFVTRDRKPIVRFRFKSAYLYDEIKDARCRLIDIANQRNERETYQWLFWAFYINRCNDPRIRDPNAINFYIYDSYNARKGFGDDTSLGSLNDFGPFVMIDQARLNHTTQGPEEHEMGHAFMLRHVCVPYAKPNTSTNIMSSYKNCRGNGHNGRRNLGFNKEQVDRILLAAQLIRLMLVPQP